MKPLCPFRCCFSLRCVVRFVTVMFVIIVFIAWNPDMMPISFNKVLKRCSHARSKKFLENLCQNYSLGLAGGPLCHALCTQHEISYDECLGHGNKIVLKAHWIDHWVVLKASKPSMKSYYVPWNHDTAVQMNKDHVESMLYDHFRLSVKPYPLNRTLVENQILSKLPLTKWKNYSIADLESLWSVLEQDEFMKLLLLAGNKHIPKLYGWCGHVYAVEYTPIGDIFQTIKFRHTLPWRERAKVALSFLEMVHSFKHTPYGEFMLCDVQQSNFGVKVPDFTVQAIDIDLAEFPRTLSDFMSQPQCRKDADCDFFDCIPYCEYGTEKCTPQAKTNNFQNICQDMFRSKHFGSKGLLENAPQAVAYELRNILEKCSVVPPNSTVKFPKSYYSDLYDQLYRLLYKEVYSYEPQHGDIAFR